jgi:hypothetical protein
MTQDANLDKVAEMLTVCKKSRSSSDPPSGMLSAEEA